MAPLGAGQKSAWHFAAAIQIFLLSFLSLMRTTIYPSPLEQHCGERIKAIQQEWQQGSDRIFALAVQLAQEQYAIVFSNKQPIPEDEKGLMKK